MRLTGAGAVITEECSSMDENKQPDELERDPRLTPGHAAIEDLEPEMEEAAAVEGGSNPGGGVATRGPTR